MDKFLKLAPETLQAIEKERLTYLIVPKTNFEQGEKLELVAFGKGAGYDDSTGYLQQEQISADKSIWTSTTSGWTGFCSRDVKPVLYEEAYKISVLLLTKLSAEAVNNKTEETLDLFGADLVAIRSETQAKFGSEKLPDSHELLFVLIQ